MTLAEDLCAFIDSSPSPFHVCRTAARELESAGYVQLFETDVFPAQGGKFFVIRGGSLIAWNSEGVTSAADGFRVIGGHTDSPNLRLKQNHDLTSHGASVASLEPYGGPLLDTWLDRDLGISGRLALRDGAERLVHVDEPIVRVPHLAIHLDREGKGGDPDRQRHLNGIWSIAGGSFLNWLSDREGLRRDDILGFELMTHDTQISGLMGAHREFLVAPRLDNQVTCFAGLQALLANEASTNARRVLALFDHEEVGSTSERGAQSDFLLAICERIVLCAGGSREDFLRSIAASVCVSGDMAHATHPNYAEKHEPLHNIVLGGGPVLKVNQNLRYATDARGAAEFAEACDRAGVPLQRYVHRADLPCGSTIGPLNAARTGMLTVDVGAPQLAMHSAREMMATADVELYVRALTSFLSSQ